jgi:hypothetical protein
MKQGKKQGAAGRKAMRHWHTIFGTFLDKRLKPAGIQVELEVKASKTLPTMDILLLRPKDQDAWNEEQRALLPDGLRTCGASRIVIEFKYTESFGYDALAQAQAYDYLYRHSERLSKQEVRTFLVCSKSPSPESLAEFGYSECLAPGVYTCVQSLGQRVDVMVLNELSDHSNNLDFKLFASKHQVRDETLEKLKNAPSLSEEALYFLSTLKVQWQDQGAQLMMIQMTEEEILEYGKTMSELIINHSSYQARLKGIPTSELLERIPARERLEGIPASERLEGIPASELMKAIPDEELQKLIQSDPRLKIFLKSKE